MDFQKLVKNIKKNKPKTDQYFGEAKPLKKNLDENIKIILELLGNSNDVIHREFLIGNQEQTRLSLFFIDGLTNGSYVHDLVLKTLMVDIRSSDLNEEREDLFNLIKNHSLPISDYEEVTDFKRLCETLLTGNGIILIDGYDKCFSIEIKGWSDRGVTESSSQTVVRGPKDSFNETLRTNTMLIRRRIKDINLRVVEKTVGTVTRTGVSILYMNGIANEKIVKEIIKRIDEIEIDSILSSGMIEQLTLDHPKSIFPTIYNSDRPDIICAGLLEGRVAIVVDGTPHTLLAPAIFVQFFHASEDFYIRAYFATFIRIIRYIAFFMSFLVPALYIAITTFHQEMVPTPLLISISAQREGVPFPALIEVLIMELTFEILREAGIRMPKAVGSAISIVGALVLGEAAVNAGIVGNIMVIIVSITAISSLISPSYDFSLSARILRFVFVIVGASFGLYGVALLLFALLLHLCSLRSFGIPYMYPIAPFNFQGFKDAIIRAPIKKMTDRPNLFVDEDPVRHNDTAKKE